MSYSVAGIPMISAAFQFSILVSLVFLNLVQSSSVQTTPDNDGDVTVAVITAALAAYLASTSPDGNVMPFRVVSFKRKNSGKPWNS